MSATPYLFQSSLELSPECNAAVLPLQAVQQSVSILTRAFARVQPSGAALHLQATSVSILTRAFARVQPDAFEAEAEAEDEVSILTRAFARVQPAQPHSGLGTH